MNKTILILSVICLLGAAAMATAPTASAYDVCSEKPEAKPACDIRNDTRDRAYCFVYWQPPAYWTRCI